MLSVKINSFMRKNSTPRSYSNTYGILQITHAIVALTVMALGGASVVVGLLSLSLCTRQFLIDTWLIVHGVTVLGSLVGLMAWRTKMAYGKIINGPKILAILLLTINFLWLIYGNVLMIFAFNVCAPSFTSLVCGSPYYIFFYVVVLLFDVFYILFFVSLCVFSVKGTTIIFLDDDVPSSDACCVLPYCLKCLFPFPYGPSWQEWMLVMSAVVYLIFAIASVIMGSIYLAQCGGQSSLPVWNIVNGLVTIAALGTFFCCLGFPGWIALSWERPSILIFIPFISFAVFLLIWLAVGNTLALEFPLEGCVAGQNFCSIRLQVFSSITVFILDLVVFVLVYVGIMFLLLMMVLSTITSCAQYCGKSLKINTESENTNNNNNVQDVQMASQEGEVN